MRNGYPLVELHRHLDGNVRLETIIDLAREHDLNLPAWTPEELSPYVRVSAPEPDLMAFIEKIEFLRHVLVDYAAVRRITRENLEDAARENIDYIELRFSPYFIAQTHKLDSEGVAEAVCDAFDEALGEVPIRAKLIGIMSRTFGPEAAWEELQAIMRCAGRHIVAVDLAGDEANYPGELFVEHFRAARESGLHTIAHAGEADGPASVRQAVRELGAERIGHAVRAAEDPATIDLLVERQIPVESCPTSNIQTSTVPSYADHPLPMFLEYGVCATLNTDDPGISGIDLAHEYMVAHEKMGLSQADLLQLQENALRAAFLTSAERADLLSAASYL
jgi:adenosine deaminase